MAERRNSKKTQGNGSGFGLIVGLGVLILLVGVVLFNRASIVKMAENARNANGSGKQTVAPSVDPKKAPPTKTDQPTASKPKDPTPALPAAQPEMTKPSEQKPVVAPPSASQPAAQKPIEQKKPVEEPDKKPLPPPETPKKQPPATPAPVKPGTKPPATTTSANPIKTPDKPVAQTRDRTLWFVHVDNDGIIERVKETRALPVSDSPLADAVGALMNGPSDAAKKKGFSSLIPPGTKLLSATVRGATAYLSFSDQFQFNSFGIEGFAAQLRQIVWTATEFDNVKDVQILIEGRRVDYLGSEGIWIGSPIDRSSL